MPDSNHESSGFRVVDRRLFSEDGSLRSEAREQEQEPAAPRPAPEASSPAAAAGGPETSDEISPAFETLVSYLSTTALLQLGLMSDPSGIAQMPDMESARRTIELLEVLREKTHGNLTRGEASLVEGVLYELHLSVVELEKRLAKKTP
jgi:3-oxoacyl-ACP reductase-like protein